MEVSLGHRGIFIYPCVHSPPRGEALNPTRQNRGETTQPWHGSTSVMIDESFGDGCLLTIQDIIRSWSAKSELVYIIQV